MFKILILEAAGIGKLHVGFVPSSCIVPVATMVNGSTVVLCCARNLFDV
jgi:hypothetical protein